MSRTAILKLKNSEILIFGFELHDHIRIQRNHSYLHSTPAAHVMARLNGHYQWSLASQI